MKLDPNTTVASLLAAIPSSKDVFDKLGIQFPGNESKPLWEVCENRGIRFEEFLRYLDEIDWDNEFPIERK